MYIYNDEDEPFRNQIEKSYLDRSIDAEKSFSELEKFALGGSRLSIIYLSGMFRKGANVSNVLERAKKLLYVAKEKNLIEASFYFGKGFYKLRDYELAFDAFSLGANNKYDPSVFNLAVMYYNGHYVNKDLQRTIDLLKISSRNGHIWSRALLAHIFLMKDFGILQKIKAIYIYMTLFYYQVDLIIKSIRKIPLDEKYYR
ncbi:hypothetical protein AiwAL_15675 [Acidiphilium sp. AL]|nr:hypothetical protein [Acidiphilium sp. AL]